MSCCQHDIRVGSIRDIVRIVVPRKIVTLGDKCKGCGVELSKDNVVYNNHYIKGKCKNCVDVVPSRTTEARRLQYVSWKFNLTSKEYKERLELQLNGCAVCKQPCKVRQSLAVDHDHKTGLVRDLLCHRCNLILGLAKDNEELLIDLIEYLKRHERKRA